MNALTWLRRSAPLLLLILAGCSHVPVTSLGRLAKLDLMSADLKALRAAVRAPSAIAPQPGGTRLVLTYWRDGEDKKTVSAVLEEDTEPGASANLAQAAQTGTRITVFRIPESERAQLESARAAAAGASDARGRRTHGSLSVSLAGCARAPLPDGPLLLTTYLKITPDGDFFPLVQDLDLRSLSGDGAGAGGLEPCAS